MDSEILNLLKTVLTRLDSIESKIGVSGSQDTNSASNDTAELPKSIREFDNYTLASLDPFVAAGNKLGYY